MTHPEELLAAFVAGTLPADRAGQVARHLADCPGCAEEATAWRRVAGAVGERAAAVPVPPAGLLDAVLSRLPDRRRTSRASVGSGGGRVVVPRYSGVLGGAAPVRAVRILTHQRRLIDRRIWPVAGAVLGIGAGFAAWVPPGSSGSVLAVVMPLVAALGLATACGNGADPAVELVAASPTGVRAVLLARLTLVLGAILAAASVASLGLAWLGAGAPFGLFAAWLGPMALLSAVSFALSVLWRPAVGIGVAMTLWALRMLSDAGSVDGVTSHLVEFVWRTSGPMLLVAALLVAGTVAVVPYLPTAPVRAYGR
ncbi:zf-HC2 domain-containing protein [Plantactinospora sp. S1510]|uniref:Zf-HC2 domain-containing protein n=1 Tax=Plantactinospora alkalitolerans TaxID=2789879 RepID=A0ABS0GPW8_9ACTN|nr:zf-HC2 domain-containing protein [Plantactinospora alkalitolerans]MBF9128231.1 zf-HC2 domain-containing protein [Plantactinospora alkalitolerans]